VGRRYSEAERAAAIEAVVNGATLEAVATPLGASSSTVRRWCIKAGIDVGALAAARDPARQTDAAREARLSKLAADKAALSELLRDGITLPAARLIAARLERAAADEALITTAREVWRDALIVEAQAADMGPDAVKGARAVAMRAKVDVMVAEAGVPDATELSLILRRAVTDLLHIEGDLVPADGEEVDFTVVLTAPRPARQPNPVVQLDEKGHPVPA
jgi:transposase-like protein